MKWALALVLSARLMAQLPSVEQAWDLVAKGRYPEAVQVLQGLVKGNAKDADARLLLGSILMELGDRGGAIEHLSAAVRLRPQSAEAQNALGEAYKAFGDFGSARAPFREAVALEPSFAAARVNLALALLHTGDMQEAMPHLDQAIALLGDRSEDAALPHFLRGKVHLEQSDAARAEADLQRAVQLTPAFPEAWAELGQAQKALLKDDAALVSFQRSVTIDPNNAITQYRLGAEYLRGGDTAKAVEHLQRSFTLNPKNQSTLNSLQMAFRRNGQPEKAAGIKQLLQDLLHERDVESENAMEAIRVNNEGAALEKKGQWSAALERYQKALQLDPKHNGIRENLAAIHLRLAHWQKGVTLLQEALRRDPKNENLREALLRARALASRSRP